MNDISVIRPNTSHAGAIGEICTIGWRQTVAGKLSEEYKQKNIEFWYTPNRVASDIEKGQYSYVALIDSEVVGVIGGAMTGEQVGEIFVLYVHENCRYKGIGRKLLQALTDEQMERGVREQWVSVQEDNQLGIPFYESRGFIYQKKRITVTDTEENQVSLRYMRKLS